MNLRLGDDLVFDSGFQSYQRSGDESTLVFQIASGAKRAAARQTENRDWFIRLVSGERFAAAQENLDDAAACAVKKFSQFLVFFSVR